MKPYKWMVKLDDRPTANIALEIWRGRRIYSQLFVRYSTSVPADELCLATELTMSFCIFNQQRHGQT
jgi:hypothetical protein